MKAVRRTRVRLAAGWLAAPLLVVLAGQAAAAPRAAPGGVAVAVGCAPGAGCGILVAVCGPDGRVTDVVRLAGSPPLLPLGRLTVRIGDPCGAGAASPPPVTTPPVTPPVTATTAGPTAAPTTAPAPSARPTASAAPGAGPAPAPAPARPGPASSAAPGAGTSPRPAAFGRAAAGPAAPGRAAGAPHAPGPSGTPGYGPPPLAGEPYDRDPGQAARWWLMTMAVVLLPAALAALPYRHIRRRH